MTDVRIPGRAVGADAADILDPVSRLLQGLNLLGTKSENDRATSFAAVFDGPPQSVAVIEAGATAASKWWSAGLGAVAASVWGSVVTFWGSLDRASQHILLWGAAIVTAAAMLGIAYLLGSDVRGRSLGAVATIEARARIAHAMVDAARRTYESPASDAAGDVIGLPQPLRVSWTTRPGSDEAGWVAVALQSDGKSSNRFLLVKGKDHAWADASEVVVSTS